MKVNSRWTAVIVDPNRTTRWESLASKDMFKYQPIPSNPIETVEYSIAAGTDFLTLRAISNDKKKLYARYFGPFVNAINEDLIAVQADLPVDQQWRVQGHISPDYTYVLSKIRLVSAEDLAAFDESKNATLRLLEKYQPSAYTQGDYADIDKSELSPSILESIQAVYLDYLVYAKGSCEIFTLTDTQKSLLLKPHVAEIPDSEDGSTP